ncbi:MAG: hypothetical protein ACI81A_001875, partial [Paraglaciecola sp.]
VKGSPYPSLPPLCKPTLNILFVHDNVMFIQESLTEAMLYFVGAIF